MAIESFGATSPRENKKQFEHMDKVWGKSSTGQIEWGWTVEYCNINGNVLLRKTDENGKVLENTIPENELSLIQKEKDKEIRKITGV